MFYNYSLFEYKKIKRFKYEKFLKISLIKQSGRSNKGRIVFYGRGGGYKAFYRIIDFKRYIINIPARVLSFKYDPNRSIFIMLLLYYNGVLIYTLAPLLIKINMYLINDSLFFIRNGNSFKLVNCLIGSFIHCLKLNSTICKYARSAGVYIQLLRKLGSYVLLRFPSKEELFVFNNNICVLGRLSNVNKKLIKKSSAGINRRLGFRPKVRGVAKNPIDHPHGGGEGRTTAGQPSVTPWGLYTKGIRTTTRFKRLTLSNWGFFRRRNGVVW